VPLAPPDRRAPPPPPEPEVPTLGLPAAEARWALDAPEPEVGVPPPAARPSLLLPPPVPAADAGAPPRAGEVAAAVVAALAGPSTAVGREEVRARAAAMTLCMPVEPVNQGRAQGRRHGATNKQMPEEGKSW
jgi:hypothetical protein